MKLINEEAKNIIQKIDVKNFKQELKTIKKLHSSLFSKSRRRFYIFFEFVVTFFHFFGLLLLLTILTLSVSLLNDLLKDVDKNYLEQMINGYLSFVYTFFAGVICADFIIGSIGNNEYFDSTELKLFLKTNLGGSQNALSFIIWDFVYLFILILSHCLNAYISCITNSIFVLYYTILVLIALISFKSKTRVNRYLKYLDSTYPIFSNKKSNSIKAFREIKNFSIKKDEKAQKDFVYHTFQCNIHFYRSFDSLMKKLDNKIYSTNDIIDEQNIIEEYLCKFIKKCDNPYQLILINIVVRRYLSTIIKYKEVTLTKPITRSLNCLLQSIIELINSSDLKILDWQFTSRDDNYQYFLIFTDYLMMVNDLLSVQNATFLYFNSFVSEILNFIDNQILSSDKTIKDNLDSIKTRIDLKKNFIQENVKDFTSYCDSKTKITESFFLSEANPH